MVNSTDESNFTRRKFTLPHHLDDELVHIAEEHYQGNVSLCLRAAFEDHKQTLNGEGEIAFGRLLSCVEEVATQQSEVVNQVESIKNEIRTQASSSPTNQSQYDSEVEKVYRELKRAEEGLRIADLSDRLDLNLSVIHSALGVLIDHGFADDRETNGERFWAIGSEKLFGGGFDG